MNGKFQAFSIPERSAGDIVHDVADAFDRVAGGYDLQGLRFYPFAADRAVHQLRIRPGEKVLDIGCGTGGAAIAAAQYCHPGGRVTAIDISAAMLDRTEASRTARGLAHVDIHDMDAMRLEFRRDYFDAAIAGQAIGYMPDMLHALREWLRVLKPGGRLLFTTLAWPACAPLAERFISDAQHSGLQLRPYLDPLIWTRLADETAVLELAAAAGLDAPRVERVPMGMHLKDPGEWWEIVWNSGFRGQIAGADPALQGRFRAAHLAGLEDLRGADGIWMDLQVLLVSGRKA